MYSGAKQGFTERRDLDKYEVRRRNFSSRVWGRSPLGAKPHTVGCLGDCSEAKVGLFSFNIIVNFCQSHYKVKDCVERKRVAKGVYEKSRITAHRATGEKGGGSMGEARVLSWGAKGRQGTRHRGKFELTGRQISKLNCTAMHVTSVI